MSKVYSVKEIFYTLQGEGANTGRPAVFLRFSGCNLWSGMEADREKAICNFCDTDFVGTNGVNGGKYQSANELAEKVLEIWQGSANRFVVCTGGEPLLQLDAPLIEALHNLDFQIAVETNGTIAAPAGIDWICVSPKKGADLVQKSGNELKLVYPQPRFSPESFEELQFEHFYLQPMDGPAVERNTRLAVDYCLKNPKWRLSLQSHKLLGIP